MPLDLMLNKRELGEIKHTRRNDRKILVLIDQKNGKKIKKNFLFTLFNSNSKKDFNHCNSSCGSIAGAARFFIQENFLICDELWSNGCGPLMLLALCIKAKENSLELLLKPPMSKEALDLLKKLIDKPLEGLNVKLNNNEYLLIFNPSEVFLKEVKEAYEKFKIRLEVESDAPIHLDYWHTAAGIAKSVEDTYLSKAAEAHH